jgi:hypothetical protein
VLKLVIDVNVNIPTLGKAFGDAVLAILPAINTLRNEVMGKLEDLELSSANLTANVAELRGKVSGLGRHH